jgi:hypothetical protein
MNQTENQFFYLTGMNRIYRINTKNVFRLIPKPFILFIPVN